MYGFRGRLSHIDLTGHKSSRHDLEKPRLL